MIRLAAACSTIPLATIPLAAIRSAILRALAIRAAAPVAFTFLLLAACAPLPVPPAAIAPPERANPPAAGPHFTADRFVTTDGERLPLSRWLPPGKPRAVVLALHGFNDYSHAFAGPAALWAKEGIATYAYDQRGFGAAPGRGRWRGSEALADDALTASELLRRRYPGVPLYLLGESMGGAVAILTATGAAGLPLSPIDGVILVAPAVWGRGTMKLLPRLLLWVAVRIAPGLTLTGQQLHIWPSDNIAMLRALARDPLVIKTTRVDAIWGLVNLMDRAVAAAPRLNGPVLVLYGHHDEIIPKRAMQYFVERLRDPQARFAYYRHGYHMLLRDREAPLVAADVAHWLCQPAAALPSGAERGALAALFGQSEPGTVRAARSRARAWNGTGDAARFPAGS